VVSLAQPARAGDT